MAQERKMKAGDRRSGLDGLVFSTRDDAVVFETNVEAFIRVETPEPSAETEANFVPFNCMHKPGEPLSAFSCPCRLNEDFIANQHAWALLRETRDR